MAEKKVVEVLVSGGRATAGPPIGPALGPLGVNVLEIVNKINEMTKDYSGMKVPVKITVDPETKEYEIDIGIPTTSALIVKEAGIEKGASSPKGEIVGNLTMEQVIKIARIKRPTLLAKSLKAAVKEILGSCISMGITVDGKDPRQVQREIDEGMYDGVIREDEE